jgi:hypothetical protein
MANDPLGSITAGIGSYNWAGLATTSANITLYVILGVLAGLFCFVIWWYFSFKHTVVIKRRVGHSYKVKVGDAFQQYRAWWQIWKPKISTPEERDVKETVDNIPYIRTQYKAKIVAKKNGIKYLKLQFSKLRLKIPGNEFHNLTGNGKLYFELVQVNEHIYWPTVLADSEKAKSVIVPDESYFDWAIQDMEESFDKYKAKQSFWEKWGAQIMIIGMLVIILMIIYMTFKDMKEMMTISMNAQIAVSENFKQAAELMRQALSSGTTQVVP